MVLLLGGAGFFIGFTPFFRVRWAVIPCVLAVQLLLLLLEFPHRKSKPSVDGTLLPLSATSVAIPHFCKPFFFKGIQCMIHHLHAFFNLFATTSDQFSSFTLHPSYYTPLLFPSHPPLSYTYRVPSGLLICTYSLSTSCLVFALVNQPGSLLVARFWLASRPGATPRPTANLHKKV